MNYAVSSRVCQKQTESSTAKSGSILRVNTLTWGTRAPLSLILITCGWRLTATSLAQAPQEG